MYDLTMENQGEDSTIERIQRLMRVRGMNRMELAKAAGIGKGTVSKILNGNTADSSPSTLTAIARALGTTLGFLRLETSNPFPDTETFPPYALEIIESLRHLEEPQQYEVLVIVRSFVDASNELAKVNLRHAIQQAMQLHDMIDPDTSQRIIEFLLELQSRTDNQRSLPSKPSKE